VLKKCGWLFYKPRQLILTAAPSLKYYDPETNKIKGTIPLTKATIAKNDGSGKFHISIPTRTYYFKEMEHITDKWVNTINDIIKNYNQS